jgi:ABC-type dipeptide/oligopeptide/nickel transport system permease component
MNGITIFCLVLLMTFATVLSIFAYRGAKTDVQQMIIALCSACLVMLTAAGFARVVMDAKADVYGDDFMRISDERQEAILQAWQKFKDEHFEVRVEEMPSL